MLVNSTTQWADTVPDHALHHVKDTRLIIKFLLTDLTHTQAMVEREVAARPLGPQPGPREGEQAQTRGKSQLTILTLEMAHYRVDLQLNSRSHLRIAP